MSHHPSRLQRFVRELRRRRVFRVAVGYVVAAWLVIQAAEVILPALHLPDWTVTLVVVLALLGFPIAVVLAWALDVTPEGVRRTASTGGAPDDPGLDGEPWRFRPGLALLLGALAFTVAAAGWYGFRTGEPDEAVTDRSIAVLPFEALGDEPDVFTEGMHDDLLTRLSNLSDLTVISRTSVQRYRGTDRPLGEIARELGVRWILEGGVQQVGDRVQVNAQLIDPHTDSHVWAESYQRTLTPENLFAIQRELTTRIARELQARIRPDERERLAERPTDDLEAYRLYVEGRAHLDRRTGEGIRRGVDLFRRAIAIDSSYALAWAGLADALMLFANYGYVPWDSVTAPARAAMDRALALDPHLAEAHAARAHFHMDQRPADAAAATRDLTRAIELKPSYARAHHWLGMIWLALGRIDDALSSLRRAIELDPGSSPIQITIALAYWYADDHERALHHARQAIDLEPTFAFNHFAYGDLLVDVGRLAEAEVSYRRATELTPEGSYTWAWALAGLAWTHTASGDTARAREMLHRIETHPDERTAAARVHVALGDHDAALRLLGEEAWTIESAELVRNSPVFDSLRDDARFQAVLEEMDGQLGVAPGS